MDVGRTLDSGRIDSLRKYGEMDSVLALSGQLGSAYPQGPFHSYQIFEFSRQPGKLVLVHVKTRDVGKIQQWLRQ